MVLELVAKGVARFTDSPGAGRQVVRVTSDETQVKRVRQMPDVGRSQQPTIAIITAQFCEKLAVDAMIENKDTYVRYKVEGTSLCFFFGNRSADLFCFLLSRRVQCLHSGQYWHAPSGGHQVASCGQFTIGHDCGWQHDNTLVGLVPVVTKIMNLTNLFPVGIFQHVEYVFLVGIGGGVPHYTDYDQHVRLGDVVVSTSPRTSVPSTPVNQSVQGNGQGPSSTDYVYVHCDKLRSSPDEPLNASNSSWKELQSVDSFNYRFWCPLSFDLQDIAKHLYKQSLITGIRPWEQYFEEARSKLHQSDDLDFVRPDESSDKLYMSIGTNDLIEMAHPQRDASKNNDEYDARAHGMPAIHFGAIGSGRMAVGNEQLRQDIALKFGLKAFDIEFDTVIESIFGNRKDRYIIIRGIADYKDGARKKEWQPYASLAAAAYMKAILCELEPMGHY